MSTHVLAVFLLQMAAATCKIRIVQERCTSPFSDAVCPFSDGRENPFVLQLEVLSCFLINLCCYQP